MLPPGRARLGTNRVPTGSVESTMTRKRLGRFICCDDRGIIEGNDDVDVETHQLGGKVGKPFSLAARFPPLHRDVVPLRIAEVAQPGKESLASWSCGRSHATQNAHPLNLSRWLPFGATRQRQPKREPAEE